MDSTVKACLFSLLLSLATAQTWPCEHVKEYCDLDGVKSDDFPLTVAATDIDTAAEECYAECNAQTDADADGDATNSCKAFTVMNVRNQFYCNLIRENCVLNIDDECIKRSPATCKSGPSDCAVPPPTCDPVVGHEDRVRWQCVDITEGAINPYNDPLPLGTRCYQTCLSWESATVGADVRLVSECIESLTTPGEGEWSETQNVDNQEMTWPKYPGGLTYYPKPDEIDDTVALPCGCKPLEVQWPYDGPLVDESTQVWYDPNTEDAAVFICDQEVVIVNGEYIIDPTNTCVLYCDDHFVATARCLEGEWTGQPEWGFWCYDEPTGI